MLHRALRTATVAALAALACSLGPGEAPLPPGSVLFIGNSLTYANNLPGMLRVLAESAGVELGTAGVAAANYSLLDHWNDGTALARIHDGDWSVVVLQQGPSSLDDSRAELLDYAGRFAAEIRAVGAQPALYGVWPEKARFGVFDRVSESYRLAADSVHGIYLPAGEGWRAAWRRDSSLALYDVDDFHPGVLGTYEAAAVMFARLTGQSATALPNRFRMPDGTIVMVPPAVAALLQAAADETIAAWPASRR